MGQALSKTVTYESTECANCGVEVWMPATILRLRLQDKRSFYCYNGHALSWSGPNEDERKIQRLNEQVARQARRIVFAENAQAAEERSHIATRGHLTRAKRRTAAGVCPCCNRSFKQLRLHMRSQHPEHLEAQRIP